MNKFQPLKVTYQFSDVHKHVQLECAALKNGFDAEDVNDLTQLVVSALNNPFSLSSIMHNAKLSTANPHLGDIVRAAIHAE